MDDGVNILAGISPLIQTLVGGALAILGAWFSARSQRRGLRMQLQHEVAKARRDLARERLEELYQHSYRYLQVLRDFGACWADVLESRISYSRAVERTTATLDAGKHDYERMLMLVEVYCPATRGAFAELAAARDTFTSHVSTAREFSKGFGERTATFPPEMANGLREAIAACEKAGEKWKASIVKELRLQI